MTAPVLPRQQPVSRLVVELADVLGLQACCVVCRGRMVVYPPSLDGGSIACLSCGREWAEVVKELPVRMTPEQWAALETPPRRGRPPRATRRVKRRPSYRPCQDCQRVQIAPGRRRCQGCEIEHRRTSGLPGKLLDLLRCSQGLRTRDLAAILGTSPDVVRQVVLEVRRRGIAIETVRRHYRLAEGAA